MLNKKHFWLTTIGILHFCNPYHSFWWFLLFDTWSKLNKNLIKCMHHGIRKTMPCQMAFQPSKTKAIGSQNHSKWAESKWENGTFSHLSCGTFAPRAGTSAPSLRNLCPAAEKVAKRIWTCPWANRWRWIALKALEVPKLKMQKSMKKDAPKASELEYEHVHGQTDSAE